MATFGKRFKELRNEKRMTQQELADHFYLNKSSISRYEQNKQVPEMDSLQKFADFFNCSVDYLLGRSDIRTKNSANEYDLDPEDLKLFKEIMNDPDISILWHDFKSASKEEILELLRSWEFIKGQFKRMKEANESSNGDDKK